MSAFKQSARKLGLLAGVVAMFVALAALSAASASASFTTGKCAGEGIIGEGSSLQNTAQATWGETTNKFDSSPVGCLGLGQPKVTYHKTSSLPALEAWGVNAHAFKTEDAYIASDEAPSGSAITGQIKEMVERTGSPILPIPVTQAAVGVIVNPPENCTITNGRINNSALEKAFSGQGASGSAGIKFSDIVSSTGAGCSTEVTRVVRADGSGTTYQFKHYLNVLREELGRGNLPCLTSQKWENLQEEVTANLTWPESCATKLSPLMKSKASGTGTEGSGSGGGDEVKTVNHTKGSIGYAALADVENNKEGNTTLLQVQNNGVETPGAHYANAGTTSGQNSNCAEAVYAGAPAAVANADWSEVYGEDPDSEATETSLYPICTLTWDVALESYSSTVIPEKKARTVFDYLNYVVNTSGGESDVSGKWYAKLPSAIQSSAVTLAEKIDY